MAEIRVRTALAEAALSLGGTRGDVDGRRIEPMRPVVARTALTREGWLYELKLDGFRLLADVRRRDVTLRYRSGHECTDAFPEIVAGLRELGAERVLLDGEVVAFDERGRPDFDRLGPRLRGGVREKPPVTYCVFDVLAVAGVDTRTVPLVGRKGLLAGILGSGGPILRRVPHTVGDGRAIAAFVVEHDLEGVVAKRASSLYVAGASSAWIKAKRRHEDEFLVSRIRWGRDKAIDAVAVMTLDGMEVVVELGAWRVGAALEGEAHGQPARGWSATPKPIAVTVTFMGRTGGGRLREPAIKGVRSSSECDQLGEGEAGLARRGYPYRR